MKFALLLCLALRLSTIQGYDVLKLTVNDYETITNGKTVFINFFAPWSAECKELAPIWEKIAKEWDDHSIGLVAEVDCSDDDSEALCEHFEVDEYPTIYYGDPLSPEQYEGELDFESLSKFAEDNVGRSVCSVTNFENCDDEDRKIISELKTKTRAELEEIEDAVHATVEESQRIFDEAVEELQRHYENLVESYNDKLEEIRDESGFKWVQQILLLMDKDGGVDDEDDEVLDEF